MRLPASQLKEFGKQVMIQAGLWDDEADIFMDNLLFADSRGIGSHGISRLINYSKRVQTGVITPGMNVEIVQEAPAALVLDGHNGIGAKIGRQAMDLSIAKAKKSGCCVTTVRNGNHFGAAGFYTEYASSQGMISLVVSNCDAAVCPTGGAAAMLGTNPLSIGVPASKNEPFNLDMATSVVARGKIVLAQKEGRPIPPGWAVDKNGNATTVPDEALNGGYMLPFGGPKGYGVSLFIDLMCSALAGANNSRNMPHFWTDYDNPQNLAYFMIVIDPSKFLPLALFEERVDSILDEFKTCPSQEGVERVLIAGEIEHEKEATSRAKGVDVSDTVVEEIRKVGKAFGVKAPF